VRTRSSSRRGSALPCYAKSVWNTGVRPLAERAPRQRVERDVGIGKRPVGRSGHRSDARVTTASGPPAQAHSECVDMAADRPCEPRVGTLSNRHANGGYELSATRQHDRNEITATYPGLVEQPGPPPRPQVKFPMGYRPPRCGHDCVVRVRRGEAREGLVQSPG
jgi:hypothetical protein